MSRKYKFHNPDGIYFTTFAVVQWVDLLTRTTYLDLLIDNLNYCVKNKGLNVHAFCFMPNHVHSIISKRGTSELGEILRDFKKYTSKELFNLIQEPSESRRNWMKWLFQSSGQERSNNLNFQVWEQDNHPIELFNSNIMMQKLDYIHMNPVKAGFVREPHHWVYSSASNYAGEEGVMEVEFLY